MSVVLGRDDNSPELRITFPLSLFSPSICPTDFPSANLSLCLLYMKVMLFEEDYKRSLKNIKTKSTILLVFELIPGNGFQESFSVY